MLKNILPFDIQRYAIMMSDLVETKQNDDEKENPEENF